ncbi:hypothetical protein [Loktanella sp. IMCC34160]|uniref:hypothetical protein n=1 Tax=Loktanella sp. IMCC34160 TaxID=2510646 RepID=UPI001F5C1E91|nr:hypothetical protein [Loktanella sp. IMCC34160]
MAHLIDLPKAGKFAFDPDQLSHDLNAIGIPLIAIGPSRQLIEVVSKPSQLAQQARVYRTNLLPTPCSGAINGCAGEVREAEPM